MRMATDENNTRHRLTNFLSSLREYVPHSWKRTALNISLATVIGATGVAAYGCGKDYPPQITSCQVPVEINANQEFQVSAKVTDDKGIKEVYIVWENGKKLTVPMNQADGIYKASLKLLSEGEYEYSIVAKDTKNQEATERGKSVVRIPLPTVIVKGIAFHDYNGDGMKEDNEPVVPRVELAFFDDKENKNMTKTDTDGTYNAKLPIGKYKLRVQKNVLGYNGQPFRFLNISKEDFYPIDSPLDIEVNGDTNYDIKLMQGFLTLPIPKGQTCPIIYFDVDRIPLTTRDWKGDTLSLDNHRGIDYIIETGTQVLASAPGTVVEVWYDKSYRGGNCILIRHKDRITTLYAHLDKRLVKAGDKVNRGDVIGLSGSTEVQFPHLHFELYLTFPEKIDISAPFPETTDLYRDIQNPSSLSWWTVDNDPKHP